MVQGAEMEMHQRAHWCMQSACWCTQHSKLVWMSALIDYFILFKIFYNNNYYWSIRFGEKKKKLRLILNISDNNLHPAHDLLV